MTNIINIKTKQPYDIYIGRENHAYGLEESIFHNPYIIGVDGDRKEVIEKFRQYAPTNKELMNNLYLIDNKTISCWCDYPKEDCHGRVLIELRKEQLKNKKYKLAVIGSRAITNKKVVFDYLDSKRDKIEIIISGGAKGVDSIAQEWAKERGFPCLIYYPKWYNEEGEYDKGAGFKRNYLIVKDADIVVAFTTGSAGTQNSIDTANQLGKKVIIHKVDISN